MYRMGNRVNMITEQSRQVLCYFGAWPTTRLTRITTEYIEKVLKYHFISIKTDTLTNTLVLAYQDQHRTGIV